MDLIGKIFSNRIDKSVKEKVKALRKEDYSVNKRAFAAAAMNNSLNGWLTLVRNINFDIKMGGSKLRARARDLAKNDPYAKKLVQLIKKNVVGPDGFQLRVKGGEYQKTGNGYEFVPDILANKKIQEGFAQWSNRKYCTSRRQLSFRELCAVLTQMVFVDGEVFVVENKGKGVNDFGYNLKIFNADYVDETLNRPYGNNYIVMGIEFDNDGAPVAYWFRKRNIRNEVDYDFNLSRDYDRITADRVHHLFIHDTEDQIRGYSHFAAIAIRLKMFYEFEEAALTKSRTSAEVPFALSRKDGGDPEIAPNDLDKTEDDSDDSEDGVLEFDNNIFKVPDGWEMKDFKTDFPNQMHEMFARVILHGVASGADVAYHNLTSNVSEANYSSARVALLDERDTWKTLHAWFIEHFLTPVFESWLEMALLSQKVQLPLAKIDKFNKPVWIGRSWQWIDPANEVAAASNAYKMRMTTLEKILAGNGLDFEETIDQIAREEKYMADKNVFLILDKKSSVVNEDNTTSDTTATDTTSTDKNKNNADATNSNGNGRKKLVTIN